MYRKSQGVLRSHLPSALRNNKLQCHNPDIRIEHVPEAAPFPLQFSSPQDRSERWALVSADVLGADNMHVVL